MSSKVIIVLLGMNMFWVAGPSLGLIITLVKAYLCPQTKFYCFISHNCANFFCNVFHGVAVDSGGGCGVRVRGQGAVMVFMSTLISGICPILIE